MEGYFLKVCVIHSAIMSISKYLLLFRVLWPMATMISSKSCSPRRTISSCPLVKGSKEPGNNAIRFAISLSVIDRSKTFNLRDVCCTNQRNDDPVPRQKRIRNSDKQAHCQTPHCLCIYKIHGNAVNFFRYIPTK